MAEIWDGVASEVVGSVVGAAIGAGAAIWVMWRTITDQRASTRSQLAEQRTLLLEAAEAERSAVRFETAGTLAAEVVADADRMATMFFGATLIGHSLRELEALQVSAERKLATLRVLLRSDGKAFCLALSALSHNANSICSELATGSSRMAISPTAAAVHSAVGQGAEAVGLWFDSPDDTRDSARQDLAKIAQGIADLPNRL